MKESEEINIKLIAAFKGVKALSPLIAIGHNNLNPKLVLRRDSIEYRSVFFSSTKYYDQIELVDIYLNSVSILGVGTTNIRLRFKKSIFTFSGNLNNLDKLKEVVNFFRDKGVPISDKAKNLISR